jgi:hypothetical protein
MVKRSTRSKVPLLVLGALAAAWLIVAACSVPRAGTGEPNGGDGSSGTTGTGGGSGGGSTTGADADGGVDGSASDGSSLIEAGDYFAWGSWAAEWWERNGGGNGSCEQGAAFDPDNGNITQTPKTTTTESELRFPRDGNAWDTPNGGPDGISISGGGAGTKNFCGRLERTFFTPEATFQFRYRRDDGVRLYVDGVRVIDDWNYESADWKSVTWTNDTARDRTYRVTYRDTGNAALLEMQMLYGVDAGTD